MTALTYGSVCSGYCAATLAWKPMGWVPKFFSEIEKFPSAILAHHYGSNMPGKPLSKNGIPNHGDFTQIKAGAGPIDLLVGGTPCQSFSVAGKRLGLDDPRGNLALEFLALAKRLNVRIIVWENVPGVLSSYSGSEHTERQVYEGHVGGEADCPENRDFAMFLSFVRECGYGFAYRVLDAQYVRVGGYPFAVPQRRRRVFVVGYLGDWRRAAAVLFDRESLRGDSAPRRQPGQGIAPTIASRPTGGGGLGTDFDLDGGLIANSGDVSYCVSVNGQRSNDAETETMIAHPLTAGMAASASRMPHEQGALVPVLGFQSKASSTNSMNPSDVMPTLDKGKSDGLAVSFAQNQRGELRTSDVATQLTTGGGKPGEGYPAVMSQWAVRRLTPTECERLQGVPDGFTQIPWRGKEAENCPDGPRYKALGNSMAVNVMALIGERISMVENLDLGQAA